MRDDSNEISPSWETILMKHHPHQRPPWWNTILMRDHPHQRSPRRMTVWRETNILKAILMRDHSSFVTSFVKPFASYIHAKDFWPKTPLLVFQYTLWMWFMFLIWLLFRIWPWDEIQVQKPRFSVVPSGTHGKYHYLRICPIVLVSSVPIFLYTILVTEHSEHTTTKTAYVHCHFALYNCCFTVVLSLELALI